MMVSKCKITGVVTCTLLACFSLLAGCPTGTGVTPPVEVDVTEPGGLITAFNAFLSADRTQLIRGDVSEGRATVTVETNLCATFEWTVCILDQPGGSCDETADPSDLLDLVLPDPDEISTRSVATASVTGDPGANGTMVRVTLITRVVDPRPDSDACPEFDGERITGDEIETRVADVRVLRPAGPLSVVLSSPRASIRPGEAIDLVARITGGRPFSPGSDPQCDTEGVQPPGNGDPYCVNFVVSESLDDAAGDPANGDLSAQAMIAAEGDTLARGTYEAPIATGPVLITVEVTDETGNTQTSSVQLTVASAQTLAIDEAQAESTQLVPGDSTPITVTGRGGTEPYTITIEHDNAALGNLTGASCSGSAQERVCRCEGLRGPAADRDADLCQITYQALIAKGSDIVTILLEDAVGDSDTFSIPINVASAQTLSVSAAPLVTSLPTNNETTINAVVTGGTAPYDVCFRAAFNLTGPVDAVFETISQCAVGDFDNCSCAQSPSGVTVPRKLKSGNSQGGVSITVRVRDAVGNEAQALTSLDISQFAGGQSVSVTGFQVLPDRCAAAGGGAVNITATTLGPVETFAWSISPGGGTITNNQSAATWVPPNTDGINATIMLTVTGSGKNASASTVVSTRPVATATANPDHVCLDDTVDLAGGPPAQESYAWECTDGLGVVPFVNIVGQPVAANTQNLNDVVLRLDQPGFPNDATCTLTATTNAANACSDVSVPAVITVDPIATAVFDGVPLGVCNNSPITSAQNRSSLGPITPGVGAVTSIEWALVDELNTVFPLPTDATPDIADPDDITFAVPNFQGDLTSKRLHLRATIVDNNPDVPGDRCDAVVLSPEFGVSGNHTTTAAVLDDTVCPDPLNVALDGG